MGREAMHSMRNLTWLTPKVLRSILKDFENTKYANDPERRAVAGHVKFLVMQTPQLGALAFSTLSLTPDPIEAALILISAGIQLGFELAEKEQELCQTKNKIN
jgi:hypothetical protein